MVTYLLIIVDVGAKVRQTIKVAVPPLQIFVSILQNLLFWLWHSIKRKNKIKKLCVSELFLIFVPIKPKTIRLRTIIHNSQI